MTPEIWQRAQQLFHDALELPEADRHAWLTEACAGDVGLFALVLELMATDASVAEQSIVPAIEVLQNAEKPELQIGQILGSYQITAFIGAGGMGQVFRAERTDGVVKQVVAIKLLRFSASAAELKRRFAIERRILARLNHPGIARFLDAGSDQADRPFVVMELIDGLPINQYCAEQKLSLTQRLQLFAKVLDAVAYAHRQLIVHRDLKPGNILVDRTGQPKLLDFGIAKPLSDIDEALRADGHTETTMRAFSIKYAAPEQMRGDPIGLGVDIYALGGILYELLTGTTALELRDLNLAKAQAQIENSIPILASKRLSLAIAARQTIGLSAPSVNHSAKALAGDLDKIVAHALKKEAHERYLTIDQFSADIEHYLRQEPISLRSSVASYRARKFVQRYKLPVALSATLLLGLVTASIAMFMQQQRLKVERDNALSQQSRAEQVTQLLTDAFEAADPSQNRGHEVKAREVLDQAARRLKDAKLDPDAYVKLSVTLASVYRSLGLVKEGQTLAEAANLQLANLKSPEIKIQLLHLLARVYKDAGEQSKRLVMIAQAASMTDVTNPVLRIDQRMLEIDLMAEAGHVIEGIKQAKMLDEQTANEFGASSDFALRTGGYYLDRVAAMDRDQDAMAVINARLGEVEVENYKPAHLDLVSERARINIDAGRVLAAAQDLIILKYGVTKLYGTKHLLFVRALNIEAALETVRGNYEKAKNLTVNCIKILRQIYPANSPILALAENNLADAEIDLKNFKSGEFHARNAIKLGVKVQGREHQAILTYKANLARALSGLGRYSEAEAILIEILSEREKRSKNELTPQIIRSTIWLAQVYENSSRIELAINILTEMKFRISESGGGPDSRIFQEKIEENLTRLTGKN